MRFRLILMLTVACSVFVASSASAVGPLAGSGIEPLTTVRVVSGVFRPVLVTYAPGDFTRLFILQQTGEIRIFNLLTQQLITSPFLDIDSIVGGGNSGGDERGMLGLAFHPDYQSNGYFYVNYTNNSSDTTIRRYSVSANPNIANPASGVTLLIIDQPFSNHNGGWIGFSPIDGFLYIGTGDGGSANDPGNRAQNINQLLGKMLRIDVDGNNGPGGNYGIPEDNPFADAPGDDEIWSYGIRNPWRNTFDRVTGDLYIADVGQNAREEINIQSSKSNGRENYGWRCMEGFNCTGLSGCTCNSNQLTDPVLVYTHSFGCSITGGMVYRGCDIPSLDGTYFYADYCSNRIWSFEWDGSSATNQTERTSELAPGGGLFISSISGFGEDARGEVYICDLFGGEVFKIVPVKPTVDSTGDLDGDCNVGTSDLLILLSNWGACDDCDFCIADLDGDCQIGTTDLLMLLANWS